MIFLSGAVGRAEAERTREIADACRWPSNTVMYLLISGCHCISPEISLLLCRSPATSVLVQAYALPSEYSSGDEAPIGLGLPSRVYQPAFRMTWEGAHPRFIELSSGMVQDGESNESGRSEPSRGFLVCANRGGVPWAMNHPWAWWVIVSAWTTDQDRHLEACKGWDRLEKWRAATDLMVDDTPTSTTKPRRSQWVA